MIRHSHSDKNPEVKDLTEDFEDRDNVAFFEDVLGRLESPLGAIVLLGQRDLPGIAVRRAQSVLRWDRRPSLWSHALIVTEAGGDAAGLKCREVTLHSRGGVFPEPAFNAVSDVTLGHYRNPLVDANVGVIGIQMNEQQVAEVLLRTQNDGVNLDRSRYDLFELLGLWQSFLWTRGTPNPLEQGVPMFNAAFVAYCYEAIGLDVTPGASERHAAPEHLWNGAVYWHKEYQWLGEGDSESARVVAFYCARDPHCSLLDPGEGVTPSS